MESPHGRNRMPGPQPLFQYGEQETGLRVGKVIGSHKTEKHFELTISTVRFTYTRRTGKIETEAIRESFLDNQLSP